MNKSTQFHISRKNHEKIEPKYIENRKNSTENPRKARKIPREPKTFKQFQTIKKNCTTKTIKLRPKNLEKLRKLTKKYNSRKEAEAEKSWKIKKNKKCGRVNINKNILKILKNPGGS